MGLNRVPNDAFITSVHIRGVNILLQDPERCGAPPKRGPSTKCRKRINLWKRVERWV